MTIAFKGSHLERDVILWGVRWYAAYPLSLRNLDDGSGRVTRDRAFQVGCDQAEIAVAALHGG